MDLPADTLARYTTPKAHAPRTEWEATIDAFAERINTPAGVKKYGEMSRGHIAKGLKGQSQLQISQLFKQCQKGRSFGALFRHITGV